MLFFCCDRNQMNLKYSNPFAYERIKHTRTHMCTVQLTQMYEMNYHVQPFLDNFCEEDQEIVLKYFRCIC